MVKCCCADWTTCSFWVKVTSRGCLCHVEREFGWRLPRNEIGGFSRGHSRCSNWTLGINIDLIWPIIIITTRLSEWPHWPSQSRVCYCADLNNVVGQMYLINRIKLWLLTRFFVSFLRFLITTFTLTSQDYVLDLWVHVPLWLSGGHWSIFRPDKLQNGGW